MIKPIPMTYVEQFKTNTYKQLSEASSKNGRIRMALMVVAFLVLRRRHGIEINHTKLMALCNHPTSFDKNWIIKSSNSFDSQWLLTGNGFIGRRKKSDSTCEGKGQIYFVDNDNILKNIKNTLPKIVAKKLVKILPNDLIYKKNKLKESSDDEHEDEQFEEDEFEDDEMEEEHDEMQEEADFEEEDDFEEDDLEQQHELQHKFEDDFDGFEDENQQNKNRNNEFEQNETYTLIKKCDIDILDHLKSLVGEDTFDRFITSLNHILITDNISVEDASELVQQACGLFMQKVPEHVEELNILKIQNHELLDRNQYLQREFDDNTYINNTLTSENHTLKQQNISLQHIHNGLEKKYQVMEDKYKKIKNKYGKMCKKCDDQSYKYDKIKNKYDRLVNRYDDLLEDYDDLKYRRNRSRSRSRDRGQQNNNTGGRWNSYRG
eukprot:510527_1